MSLQEWYGKREVLLTGVTSELGRNLLEKLLRCFPNIKVHLVFRSRRGLSKLDRIKEHIFNTPGYERLHQEQPDAFSRLIAYEGNLVYERLGTRTQDQKQMSNVTVVFHAAGASECLLKFCQELPNLQAVVMATDLFRCNEDQVSEDALRETIPSRLPLGIVRLPALGPSYRDPMPGYVERLNGATAAMVGAGYILGHKDLPVQIIPRDLATNTLIAAARQLAIRGIYEEPMIYNAATINCSWSELIHNGNRANRNYPYPTFRLRGITSSRILHWFIILLFEWMPSIICDTILRRKDTFINEHKRVRNILKGFERVTLRTLSIQRQNIFNLEDDLSPQDKELFPIRANMDIEAYLLCAAAATRKYCVDERNLMIIRFFMPTFLALLCLGCGYYFLQ